MRALCFFSLLSVFGCAPAPREPIGTIELDTTDGAFHLVVTPTPDPPTSGAGAFEVEASINPGGEPFAGTMTATAIMPEMGHGASEDPVVEMLADGSFRVDLEYSMPGLWDVTFELTEGDLSDVAVVSVDVE